MKQLQLFIEETFEPKARGRLKGRFEINGDIYKWNAWVMRLKGHFAVTFLALYGKKISETGFKSHIVSGFDIDDLVRNNEHHTQIYQVIHSYIEKYKPKKNRK